MFSPLRSFSSLGVIWKNRGLLKPMLGSITDVAHLVTFQELT